MILARIKLKTMKKLNRTRVIVRKPVIVIVTKKHSHKNAKTRVIVKVIKMLKPNRTRVIVMKNAKTMKKLRIQL